MGLESFLGQKKENIVIRPENVEIPPDLQDVAKQVETSFRATKQDAQGPNGQPLIQTPQTQPLTVTIAPNEEALKQMTKGNLEEAGPLTPLNAMWWARAVEKAIHFGKQVIFGQPKVNQPV